jgi:hypothetical protein
LFDQLIRNATSVGANLVEGGAGSLRKDWKNFYVMALKINELIKEADEISNIVAAIIINSEKE